MSLSLDLPAAPLLAGHEPELLNSPVTLHTFNKELYKGCLQELSMPLQQLTIRCDSGKISRIAFKQIRYLVFEQAIESPTQPHPLVSHRQSVEMPAETADFKVEFYDGKVLTGRTRAFLLDNYSLHLFYDTGNNKVIRLFIPLAAMQRYYIGQKLGQVLLHKNVIDQDSLNSALKKQKNDDKQTYISATKKTKKEKQHESCVIEDSAQLRQRLAKTSPGIISTTSDKSIADSMNIKSIQLDDAWKQHAQGKGKRLGEILQEMGLLDDEEVYHALAYKLGLPFVRLHHFDFDNTSLSYLPMELARKYKVMPLLFEHDRLIVVTSDPTNAETIDMLRFVSGHNIEVAVATDDDVEWAIDQYYGSFQQDNLINRITDETEDEDKLSTREIEELAQKKPIVRFVHNILVDAICRKASDIHIRPEKKYVDLVYRIDGTLIKIRSFSRVLLAGIVSRIKIIGRMDIAERRLPQDGRAQYITTAAVVDLRISVMPTVDGESVVIRILNVEVGLKTIQDLGFNETDHIAFINLLHKSNGILLVTGPTGSGKSTTLYAALQEIQKQNVNIITVEDPVEYQIEHILQIQINPATGYTFARALRNILRHDPDVIMIGEIRDHETAQIAVESALTGHLVLSTLHTNDAAGTIARLLEMEIEPYLLNSSILGIVAQRLVRKNCPHCLEEEIVDSNLRQVLGVADDEVFYHGVGCDHCNNTGYSGRMGVYELLVVTDEIRQYVKKDVTADELRKVALTEGMISLTQNALAAARQRVISFAEVYRVRLE